MVMVMVMVMVVVNKKEACSLIISDFVAVFYVFLVLFMAPFGLAMYPFTAILYFWFDRVDRHYND
jgi:hypothetical protein